LTLGGGLFRWNMERWRAAVFDHRTYISILFAITLGMYFGLARRGDIDWPDASRHALNGAFVLDFIEQLPWRHPIEFAYDYYRQWPALTILFYPPLFYGVLAAVYAVLGVSEASALLTELAFLFLLAWGAFCLSRHWLDPPPALAVALLLLGAPEVAFWGRQIMLDVPSYAFLVWAAEFLVRHLKSGKRSTLFAAVICVVAAAYTKYNAIFFVVPIAISLLYAYGWRVVLQAAALGGVLLLPLVGIFSASAATISIKRRGSPVRRRPVGALRS
jgi:4-amino-4-deoxy-L-arabinose transferase-like glycosyltransferase